MIIITLILFLQFSIWIFKILNCYYYLNQAINQLSVKKKIFLYYREEVGKYKMHKKSFIKIKIIRFILIIILKVVPIKIQNIKVKLSLSGI